MGLTRPRWCWSPGEKGPGRRHLYKAAPWQLVRGVLGLFGDSWSPNFASDRLLNLFSLDSSALFNFSQADDHACFKSFRNSLIQQLSTYCVLGAGDMKGPNGQKSLLWWNLHSIGADKKQMKQNVKYIIC